MTSAPRFFPSNHPSHVRRRNALEDVLGGRCRRKYSTGTTYFYPSSSSAPRSIGSNPVKFVSVADRSPGNGAAIDILRSSPNRIAELYTKVSNVQMFCLCACCFFIWNTINVILSWGKATEFKVPFTYHHSTGPRPDCDIEACFI